MKSINAKNVIQALFGAAGALLLASCAGSAPSAKFSQTIPAQSLITKGDTVTVQVNAQPGVAITAGEKDRVRQQIASKINTKKQSKPSARPPKSFDAMVTLTKYDKGNQFARAMLAGLGQIKIRSIVELYESSPRQKVGEANVNKTFAWGGLYGGFTSMENVEEGYADGVAAALIEGK